MMTKFRHGPRFNGSIATARISGHPAISDEWLDNPWQYMSPLQREFALQKTRNTKSKDNVTLAGPDMRIKKKKPGEERAAAEQRMMERIQRAVDIMTFGIEELCQCQDTRKSNSPGLPISLGRLVELTQSLAKAGHLPMPEFVGLNRMATRINSRVCMNCGGYFISQGGRPMSGGFLNYSSCPRCEEIKQDTKLAEISAERRSREQAMKWVTEDVKRMTRILNETEKKARKHD
jgi:hypothetical protein